MNKQELIAHFQEQKKIAEKEIAFWQAQPDDVPEKPKLRHGDFGMNMVFPRIVINKAVYNASGEFIRNVDDGAIGKNCAEIWFGNIFKMMEGWGEPFEVFRKYGILLEPSSTDAIFIDAGGSHLTLSEAEEFHNALGHALITLKKKQ